MGDGFPTQTIHAGGLSPAVELSNVWRESFPIGPVLELVKNLWQVSCKLCKKVSHEFFELEVANQCDAGDRIIPFLRGNIYRFEGSARVD